MFFNKSKKIKIKNDQAQIKIFIIKTSGFLMFLIFNYILFFEIALFRIGETGNYDHIVNQQIKNKLILGRKISNETLNYKIIGTKVASPDILILGTSRIMGVRQEMFSPYKIYNAGVSASSSRGLLGMKVLLESISESNLPKYIIIGLDPWLFNPKYPENILKSGYNPNNSLLIDYKNKLRRKNLKLFLSLKKIKDNLVNRPSLYISLIDQPINWFKYLFKERSFRGFGLNAKILNTGFRYDGSYQYPKGYQINWDDDYINHVKFLNNNSYRFASADYIGPNSIKELKDVLDIAQKKRIMVIALLTPFSPNLYKALMKDDVRSVFIKEYEKQIPLIFNEYGFICYNLSDIMTNKNFSYYEENFLDGMHPDEMLMEKIIQYIRVNEKL
jgi:hypothetical protein